MDAARHWCAPCLLKWPDHNLASWQEHLLHEFCPLWLAVILDLPTGPPP